MKIKHIEPIAVSLPLTKPVKMAGVELTTADNLVVRIESDGGIVGWGESASAPIMTGETVESMVAAVRHLAPYVAGRAADDFAGASSVMNLWMYGNQAAKGAIEMCDARSRRPRHGSTRACAARRQAPRAGLDAMDD